MINCSNKIYDTVRVTMNINFYDAGTMTINDSTRLINNSVSQYHGNFTMTVKFL